MGGLVVRNIWALPRGVWKALEDEPERVFSGPHQSGAQQSCVLRKCQSSPPARLPAVVPCSDASAALGRTPGTGDFTLPDFTWHLLSAVGPACR